MCVSCSGVLGTVLCVMENEVRDCQAAQAEVEADLREAEGVIDELQAENISLRARFDDGDRSGENSEGDGDDDDAREDTPHPDGDKKERDVSRRRKRKQEQARNARELVAGGAVLTRAGIGKLNKSEARAYLSSMGKASVRGNQPELIARLTTIFEMNHIDTYRSGDALSVFPHAHFGLLLLFSGS